MRFILRSLLVVGVAVGALSGCRPAPQNNLPQELGLERRTDDLGRPVLLAQAARRVVVIGPGAVETAYALGAGSQLVGRDQIADFPAECKSLPVVGDFKGPYPEKVAVLRPDLVIVQGETWDRARVEQWQREIGAPVAALTASTLSGVATDMEKMGHWLGQSAKASSLAGRLRAAATPPPAGAPLVLVEIQRSPLWSAGKATLVGEVVEAGHFRNLASERGLKGYGPFGQETLLARQPAAYLVTTRQNAAEVTRELRSSPVLSRLQCVQRGRVVTIDGDLLLRPGPRLIEGIGSLRQQAKKFGKL